MAIKEVLINLNELKAEGVIQDYAIMGGYACGYYGIELPTFDLDVAVILKDEHDLVTYLTTTADRKPR